MERECTNIYKRARKSAHMTQEVAAERLGYSISSLQDFEKDANPTPVSMAIAKEMSVIYEAPWLMQLHVHYMPGGEQVVPMFKFIDLPQAVMQFQLDLEDFMEKHSKDMRTIASDGIIHPHEQDRWNEITDELFEIMKFIWGVKYAKEVEY